MLRFNILRVLSRVTLQCNRWSLAVKLSGAGHTACTLTSPIFRVPIRKPVLTGGSLGLLLGTRVKLQEGLLAALRNLQSECLALAAGNRNATTSLYTSQASWFLASTPALFCHHSTSLDSTGSSSLQVTSPRHRLVSKTVHTTRAGGRSGSYRLFSSGGTQSHKSARYKEELRRKNRQFALYSSACVLFVISFTYLSVPLYRIFCAKTGIGGKGEGKAVDQGKYETRAKPVSGKRVLTVKFNADTSNTMPWKFRPEQHEIKVLPGEAALAFFKAENKSNDDIIGVASYNIQPDGASLYFNKIQCFCFEEQMLRAREQVDMPVFFFIDPDFLNDRGLDQVDTITLSYTFFKSGDSDAPASAGMHVPVIPSRDKSGEK